MGAVDFESTLTDARNLVAQRRARSGAFRVPLLPRQEARREPCLLIVEDRRPAALLIAEHAKLAGIHDHRFAATLSEAARLLKDATCAVIDWRMGVGANAGMFCATVAHALGLDKAVVYTAASPDDVEPEAHGLTVLQKPNWPALRAWFEQFAAGAGKVRP